MRPSTCKANPKRLGLGSSSKIPVAERPQHEAAAFAETLLANPAIRAAHICTPNAAHFPVAKAALEAGKHVLCEKPLATSPADAAALAALAKATGLRNCTCHNLRYYPMVQQMRRMREAGDLGDTMLSFKGSTRTRKTGCSTTPIGTGESMPMMAARRALWPTSGRTGATWPNTSRTSASLLYVPIFRRFTKLARNRKAPSRRFPKRRETTKQFQSSLKISAQ